MKRPNDSIGKSSTKRAKSAKAATNLKPLFSLPGSHKDPIEGAKVVGKALRDEHLEVTVRLRPGSPLPDASKLLGTGSTPAQTMLVPNSIDVTALLRRISPL